MPDYGDYDQREENDEPELDLISRSIYMAGAASSLRAVLTALEQGAEPDDIRQLCEAALTQLEKKDPDA